jgi:hypothetical protein
VQVVDVIATSGSCGMRTAGRPRNDLRRRRGAGFVLRTDRAAGAPMLDVQISKEPAMSNLQAGRQASA